MTRVANQRPLAAAFAGCCTAKHLAEVERLLETPAALGQAEREEGK